MNVCVVGAGKLAWSLIPALQAAGHQLIQLLNRSASRAASYADHFGIPYQGDLDMALRPEVQLVWLTVADGAIPELASRLAPAAREDRIWVHSSGSVPASALDPLGPETGVIYPLQIFTPGQRTPLQDTPVFVEGKKDLIPRLTAIARSLSSQVQVLSSEDRLRLHLGAVLGCNFPTLLWRLAEAQLPPGLGIDVYEPLIRHTLEQVLRLGPTAAQTGPAIRGDQRTLDSHLELLKEEPDLREVYRLLSDLIRPKPQSEQD